MGPQRFEVVLVAPQIAGNTGNIIRLCANVGARLHLVEPLGFSLEDRLLRRAGLDYHDLVDVGRHADWLSLTHSLAGHRRYAFSSQAKRSVYSVEFQWGDAMVFGSEADGLSPDVLGDFDGDEVLRLPMQPHNRSLNLSNAVAVVMYEAWRQQGFANSV